MKTLKFILKAQTENGATYVGDIVKTQGQKLTADINFAYKFVTGADSENDEVRKYSIATGLHFTVEYI